MEECSLPHLAAEFLAQHGIEDADLAAYVASTLEDGDVDAEEAAETVGGLVPAASPAAITDLLARARALASRTADASTGPGPAATELSPGALVRSLKLAPQSGPSSSEGEEEAEDEPPGPRADPAAAAALAALFPGADPAFLEHVLLLSGPDMDAAAAAAWLVEAPGGAAAAEARWKAATAAAAQAAAAAAAAEAAAKARVLAKFDQVAVGAGPSRPAVAWGDGGGGSGQGKKGGDTIRFVNGQPVRTKAGQKYVVERLEPEWDGGSKGKVYTKGKRGKGVVG